MSEWPNVKSALLASGIRHLRDGQPNEVPYGSRLTQLASAGVTHSLGFTTNTSAAQILDALSAQSPNVDFVEPQNEIDASGLPASQWVGQIRAEQKILFDTVTSSKNFAGIPVLGPALSTKNNYSLVGDLDSIVEAGNLHDATCSYNPGTANDTGIAYSTKLLRKSTSKIVWTTETGYTDDASRPCALPDGVIAKYDPRTVTERFLQGEYRTYFYQLADVPADTVFGHMGLIDAAGRPKPQLLALGSMIRLLSDPGSSFMTHPLYFNISGATQDLHHLLLEKRDGSYFLLLWLEVPSWKAPASNIGGATIPVTSQTITVTTASNNAVATLYSYGNNWALQPTSLPGSVRSYTFGVADSVLFLHLTK